jgi:hypothetical protein
LIVIKAVARPPKHRGRASQESPMILTPFLTLVLAGYAVFMLVLGAVWIRSFVASLRAAKR